MAMADLNTPRLVRVFALLVAVAGASCAVTSDDLVPREVREAPGRIQSALATLGELEGTDDPRAFVLRQELRRLTVFAPRDASARTALGALALQMGDPIEAGRELDAALSLEPGRPTASLLRARLLLAEGNGQRARRVVETALLRAPGDAELYLCAAQVEHLDGRPEAALTALDRARELGADDVRVLMASGLVAEAAGEPEAARVAYVSLLELDPEHVEARSRLAALPR
jgi:Flp pilus assembly protein TadD